MEAFLRALHIGYEGALTIEREYSPDQAGDIQSALALLETMREEILGVKWPKIYAPVWNSQWMQLGRPER